MSTLEHEPRGRVMAAEMAEQPAVLRDLQRRGDEVADALSSLAERSLAGVVIIARGSSDHAAIYGRYLLELAARRPVTLAAPSLHTRYRADTDYTGYLAVAVSQSGHTPEIVDVLHSVRDAGATSVAVTNDPGSPLAGAADAVIQLGAGDERAVPATKTFTAQLAAFALLAQALGPVPWDAGAWAALPDQMEALLADRDAVGPAVDELRTSEGVIHIGRGFLFGAALEGALKMKETTGLLAEGFSSADFLHGPIAVAAARRPALCYLAPGPVVADVEQVAVEAAERGAPVIALEMPGAALPRADLRIPVTATAEALAPLLHTVRAQQLALELSLALGIDPDNPFGLSKVTQTD
jgi:glutamine---fructose-6-phosphate transaminase (isomerizing)